MKTVRVMYTILHTFEVPDDATDFDMQFDIEGFAESEGFLSLTNDIEASVVDKNGKVKDVILER